MFNHKTTTCLYTCRTFHVVIFKLTLLIYCNTIIVYDFERIENLRVFKIATCDVNLHVLFTRSHNVKKLLAFSQRFVASVIQDKHL